MAEQEPQPSWAGQIVAMIGGEAAAYLVVLGLILGAAALAGRVPALMGQVPARRWEALGAGGRLLTRGVFGVWGVLVLVAAASAIKGGLALIRDPSSGGIGLGALLVALLGAPFLIWGTAIRQNTLDIQREGHITDRISKAVEQLGAELTVMDLDRDGNTVEHTAANVAVRIGGILALERIAQDSTRLDNGRDHVGVMQILCAYIRVNAPAHQARDFPLPAWQPLSHDADHDIRRMHVASRNARFGRPGPDSPLAGEPNALEWAMSLPRPREDIALALRVIGRRSTDQRRVEAAWPQRPTATTRWPFERPDSLPDPRDSLGESALPGDFEAELNAWKWRMIGQSGYVLDLRDTNLQRADLAGLDLSGAFLGRARLDGANLRKAGLRGSFLTSASLIGAQLVAAQLDCADLSMANLEAAQLEVARCDGCVGTHTNMNGANMIRASLCHAQLNGSMEAVDLRGSRRDGAAVYQL